MKTYVPKPDDIKKVWYLIDAKEKVLGRLAVKIANILSGKNKAQYTPYIDTGDYVVVINAEKVLLTGNKLTDKIYYSHSQYPGGLRSKTAKELLESDPEQVLYKAVKGMLPKNKLGRAQLKKLKIYHGENHKHQAQKLKEISV